MQIIDNKKAEKRVEEQKEGVSVRGPYLLGAAYVCKDLISSKCF